MTHLWQLPRQTLVIGRRPLVMGIVNVTPDSFSDGGRYPSTDAATAHGLELVLQGADLLDIGGESTRPGAEPVPLERELERVVPVVEALARQTAVPLSVDTSKAAVARRCVECGASIINDVTALAGDAEMAAVARASGAGIVLMHMQGTPATMQQAPHYEDVIADIARFFRERLDALTAAGVEPERLILDPGIGFGKTLEHNLELLARLEEFQQLGRPLCLGVSRKGFIGRVLDRDVEQRLAGSLAAVCYAMSRSAVQVVRVHDVRETRDAVTLFAAVADADPRSSILDPRGVP
jgi:dihydropteroate synthase